MKSNLKFFYIFMAIIILSVSTIGATYAYWTATTASTTNAVYTQSTIFSISMDITPLYHGFSVIPMDDVDALKAVKNGCKDKYGRGSCSAYTLYVYNYNTDLGYISGIMDVTTNNMQNLSYMVLKKEETYDEDKCAILDDGTYCIAKEASSVGEGEKLSLGDAYDITGTESTTFILLIWLSNLRQSQNDIDVGSFEAVVTMQAGSGGEIKGSISSVIVPDDSDTETDNENKTENIKNGESVTE